MPQDENMTKEEMKVEVELLRRRVESLKAQLEARDSQTTHHIQHIHKSNGALRQELADQKRLEGALREQRDRAQKYLDVVEVMLIALNERGEISMINRKGCRILGYEEAELIGEDWFDTCLPSGKREEVRFVLQRLLRGEVDPVEYWENPVLTRSGEERIIAWHNTLLRDDAGEITGTLSSGEDITERKRAEEERERLIAELRSAATQIKTLSGLLPICMSCKKIRDDAGYWKELEEYIRDHTEADFTHGLCPDCGLKHYPEVFRNSEAKVG